MRARCANILGVTILIAACPARAQIADCRFDVIGTGHVATVIDGRSFTLADGREVKLAGIEVPLPKRLGEEGDAASRAAKAALQSAIAGRDVTLRAPASQADRYGRLSAYVFPEGSGEPVQHVLLAQGAARMAARVDTQGCAATLLTREKAAREAKLGLWADPVYDIRRADNPATILSERGRFAVVEGKVLSVRESGASIYMNFARRWSRGFAVTISKRDARAFAAAGAEPKTFEGRVVRVRGFIEERSGPRIEATRPEQIEIAGQN